MSVTTMRAEDCVGFRQMRTDASRYCFLPDVCMTRPVNKSALMTAREFLFRMPDNEHGAIQRQNLVIGH
jgi:hypothetical protein